jgi:O-acetyl-ADP-ribose deacetylase (regulator of RNase III)
MDRSRTSVIGERSSIPRSDSDDEKTSSRSESPGHVDGMGARAATSADAFNRLGEDNYTGPPIPEDAHPPRGYRAQMLRTPLSAAQEKVFRTSIKDWLACDRAATGAWRCCESAPVSVADLRPLDVSFLTGTPAADAARAKLDGKFFVFDGPVTALSVDAIVNAANEGCLGGGGVDGAIHSAAGPLLMRECATFHGCATGHTRITKGYNLPARTVLHTVGPVGERPSELRSCYKTCMQLARRHHLRSVAFCCVSTGIFGYPLANATKIALAVTVQDVLAAPIAGGIESVVFACFRAEEARAYRALFPKVAAAVVEASQPHHLTEA